MGTVLTYLLEEEPTKALMGLRLRGMLSVVLTDVPDDIQHSEVVSMFETLVGSRSAF